MRIVAQEHGFKVVEAMKAVAATAADSSTARTIATEARDETGRLIANLGYGSRKEVAAMFREGRITDARGEVLYADDKVDHDDVRVDGEPLDPPAGLVLMLHKPVGYTCSTKDPGRIVYDLLPPRFACARRCCRPSAASIATPAACC